MSRYSITNECLDAIDSYEEQSFIAEMSVLTSLLDAYDHAITIMEYTKDDYAIQPLHMFQESTFFVEAETQQDGAAVQQTESQGQGEAQPAAQPTGTDQNNQSNEANNKNSQPKQMTEEERKEHNKEHWVRRINKKGNVENIFISILLFIPRFFQFLIRSLVKFVKKIFKKEDGEKAKAVAAATPEQKKAAVAELGNEVVENKSQSAASTVSVNSGQQQANPASTSQNEGGGNNGTPSSKNPAINVNTGVVKEYFDGNAVVSAVQGLINLVEGMGLGGDVSADTSEHVVQALVKLKQIEKKFVTDCPNAVKAFTQSLNKTVSVPVTNVQDITNKIMNSMNQLTKALKSVNEQYSAFVNNYAESVRETYKDQADVREKNISQMSKEVQPLKDMVTALKNYCDAVARQGLTNIVTVYNQYSANLNAAYQAILGHAEGNAGQLGGGGQQS